MPEASTGAPEDLYGVPLEEFIPARDALAKELKAAGHKEQAAEVKGLRKPSLAAWALNMAARRHPEAVETLQAAGADLRAAQQDALGGGDAARLREASRALGKEVDRVLALAAAELRAAGRDATAAQQEKLTTTLRTAAVDVDAGEVLARGVLVDDLEAAGFGLLGALSGDRSASPPPGPTPARTAPAGEDGERQPSPLPGAERVERKPKVPKELLDAVEAARRELRRGEAEVELAATRAGRRAARAEAAASRAIEAQREAEEARSEAEEAAGEAEAARRRATEAAAALAAAEAALP